MASADQRLFEAIRAGDVGEVEAALAGGANPNAIDAQRGDTALVTAIEWDQPAVLRVLIEHGGDVNYATPAGWTALHSAVDVEVDSCNQDGVEPDFRLVGPLLDAGADVAAPWNNGHVVKTPVDIAVDYNWTEGVDRLTERSPRDRS